MSFATPNSRSDIVFDQGPILPEPPAGAVPVVHNREYRVESYCLESGRLLIQGALRDQKGPGVYVPGDANPLTIHHMIVVLEVSVPDLTIRSAEVSFPTHPHATCPVIIEHYNSLVGLSISRGFTHKIRELFGGLRGCSHTTALLQAMAPVAMQSLKGVDAVRAEAEGRPHPMIERPPGDTWKKLANTCHVWAEGGPRLEQARRDGFADPSPVILGRIGEVSGEGSSNDS